MNGQVLQAAKERLKAVLRTNGRAVWDATNLRRDFRGVPLRLGFEYGALVTLVVLQLPATLLFTQNASRTRQVPEGVIAGQLDGLEFPYLHEAHRTLLIGAGGRRIANHGFCTPEGTLA